MYRVIRRTSKGWWTNNYEPDCETAEEIAAQFVEYHGRYAPYTLFIYEGQLAVDSEPEKGWEDLGDARQIIGEYKMPELEVMIATYARMLPVHEGL